MHINLEYLIYKRAFKTYLVTWSVVLHPYMLHDVKRIEEISFRKMLSTSRIRFDTVKRFAIMSHVESFKENLKVFGSKQEIRISNEYLLSPDRKHTTIPRQMDNQLDISKHLLRTLLHAYIECHDKDL